MLRLTFIKEIAFFAIFVNEVFIFHTLDKCARKEPINMNIKLKYF